MRRSSLLLLPLLPFLLHCASSPPAPAPEASRTSMSEMVTLTGEVAAIDLATRHVTLRGPLGGEVSGAVQTDVKNLEQVNVGDMVTIIYYQSTVLSASKKGEPNPLFTGGEAETAGPGEKPAAYASTQTQRTVTVFSVDAAKGSVVFEGEDGTLFPVEVKRPEFVQKLQGLRTGDKIDVVVTEAVITGVTAAQPGDKPSVSYGAATVVVDNGEVVRRINNVLFIRNEHGRMIKVKVDPTFKFMLDGQEATVEDLEPGTKLHRTAFRVVESVTYEAE